MFGCASLNLKYAYTTEQILNFFKLLVLAGVHAISDMARVIIMEQLELVLAKNTQGKFFNVASWVPVDHDPVPPAVVEYFRRSQATPIAMSKFGADKLSEAGLSPTYVPHAIDTQIFQPLDRATSRRIVAEVGLVPAWWSGAVPPPSTEK